MPTITKNPTTDAKTSTGVSIQPMPAAPKTAAAASAKAPPIKPVVKHVAGRGFVVVPPKPKSINDLERDVNAKAAAVKAKRAVAAAPKTKVVIKGKKTKSGAPAAGRKSGDGVTAAEAPRKVIYFSEEGRKALPSIEAYCEKNEISWNGLVLAAVVEFIKQHPKFPAAK